MSTDSELEFARKLIAGLENDLSRSSARLRELEAKTEEARNKVNDVTVTLRTVRERYPDAKTATATASSYENSTSPRGGAASVAGFQVSAEVKKYATSHTAFQVRELIEAIKLVNPEVSVNSIQAAVSRSTANGDLRKLGNGSYESLIATESAVSSIEVADRDPDDTVDDQEGPAYGRPLVAFVGRPQLPGSSTGNAIRFKNPNEQGLPRSEVSSFGGSDFEDLTDPFAE